MRRLLLILVGLNSLTSKAAYFTSQGPMLGPLALLTNGKVLVAGNAQWTLFDPQSDSGITSGPMLSSRTGFTLTVLRNGKVLAAGGNVATAELFDPITKTWSATTSMHFQRSSHTSTLLPDGRVLIIGGNGSTNVLSSAEIYDPVAATWTLTAPMRTNRAAHVAAILPGGKVLVAGGYRQEKNQLPQIHNSAEIFDPATGLWSLTGSMITTRRYGAGCLLGNGKVLMAGGDNFGAQSGTELFDPVAQVWTATGPMATARSQLRGALLPNGQFFVSGNITAATETYNPLTGIWSASGSSTSIHQASDGAVLLPNGRVLMGGNAAEIYDPTAGFWMASGPMMVARGSHTTTILTNGDALVTGGSPGGAFISACEIYNSVSNIWRTTSSMGTARGNHTSTLLPNGLVLVAGGTVGPSTATASCELFKPSDESWVATAPMQQPRSFHSAMLLPNGKVLIIGGASTPNSEIYDPATGSWSYTGALINPRDFQTAGYLPNGTVIYWGGYSSADAHIFDLGTGLWKYLGPVGAFVSTPSGCAFNGGVICCGGRNSGTFKPDPAVKVYTTAGSWSSGGSMTTARYGHRATLLYGGKALISGGTSLTGTTNTAELTGPLIGISWRVTGSMATNRTFHTCTLLPNGRILAAGGGPDGSALTSYAELFDEGIVASNAAAPMISNITAAINFGDIISIDGAGFTGTSEASGGNGSLGASTAFPILQLYSIETGQSIWPGSSNWSSNSFISNPIYGIPPGYAVARLYVNGIPSSGSIILINPPATSPPTISLASSGPATNRFFQVSFTNAIGGVFGMFVSSNANSALSAWTPLGRVPEITPGQFQFIDPQPGTNAARLYSVKVP